MSFEASQVLLLFPLPGSLLRPRNFYLFFDDYNGLLSNGFLQDLRICLHLDIQQCGWLIILTLEDLALHGGLPQAFASPRGEHLIKCLQLAHQGTQPLTQGLREGEVPEELSGLRNGHLRSG